MDDLKSIIGKVATGATLSRDEAASAFDAMMSGEATPSQMGGLLMALRVRGETVDEITGAVSAMRGKMLRVTRPPDAVDVVGTGGDGSGSVNVSTCASFIVAGAGVPVAKHGNRALSSRSGAADVLASLGVKIDLTPEQVGRCVAEAGIGFMFAPAHHPAMKNVGPTRGRTRHPHDLQPARPAVQSGRRQAADGRRVLAAMGAAPGAGAEKPRLRIASGWCTARTGSTKSPSPARASSPRSRTARSRSFEVTPEEAGLAALQGDALKGGDADANAIALQSVLDGKPSPYRDVALLNAAAALIVAGRAKDLKEGVAIGAKSLDSGAAAARLKHLIAVSNG